MEDSPPRGGTDLCVVCVIVMIVLLTKYRDEERRQGEQEEQSQHYHSKPEALHQASAFDLENLPSIQSTEADLRHGLRARRPQRGISVSEGEYVDKEYCSGDESG